MATRDVDEQAQLHLELIADFQKRVDWQRGDLLYYVRGTETHTAEKEHEIAREAGAQGECIYDHLQIDVNGALFWFVHHGPGAGKGANEGNILRNWLRDIYWDSVKDKLTSPDLVLSGHVHTPSYNSYVVNDRGKYRTIHAVILPSLQAKTRYAYKVAPVARNKIGGVIIEVSAQGDIRPPVFFLQETHSISRVMV